MYIFKEKYCLSYISLSNIFKFINDWFQLMQSYTSDVIQIYLDYYLHFDHFIMTSFVLFIDI